MGAILMNTSTEDIYLDEYNNTISVIMKEDFGKL